MQNRKYIYIYIFQCISLTKELPYVPLDRTEKQNDPRNIDSTPPKDCIKLRYERVESRLQNFFIYINQ